MKPIETKGLMNMRLIGIGLAAGLLAACGGADITVNDLELSVLDHNGTLQPCGRYVPTVTVDTPDGPQGIDLSCQDGVWSGSTELKGAFQASYTLSDPVSGYPWAFGPQTELIHLDPQQPAAVELYLFAVEDPCQHDCDAVGLQWETNSRGRDITR